MSATADKLRELIKGGFEALTIKDYESWHVRVSSFLSQSFEPQVFVDFQNLLMQMRNDHRGWDITRDALVGMLEGLLAKTVDQDSPLGLAR